jgi:hypothetical protein
MQARNEAPSSTMSQPNEATPITLSAVERN